MRRPEDIPGQTRFVRHLRSHQTGAEVRVWNLVRARRLLGLKFRRQHPIAGFVVDFYCRELNLVLELEGDIHSEPRRAAFDRERTARLRSLGFQVVRLRNEDATEDMLRRVIAEFGSPLP